MFLCAYLEAVRPRKKLGYLGVSVPSSFHWIDNPCLLYMFVSFRTFSCIEIRLWFSALKFVVLDICIGIMLSGAQSLIPSSCKLTRKGMVCKCGDSLQVSWPLGTTWWGRVTPHVAKTSPSPPCNIPRVYVCGQSKLFVLSPSPLSFIVCMRSEFECSPPLRMLSCKCVHA